MTRDAGFRGRFIEALIILCRERPSDDNVDRWLADDESHLDAEGFERGNHAALTLQDWAASNAPAIWMMGITIIEAAEGLADEPRDGYIDHPECF